MSKLFNHGSYHYFAIINPIPGSWGFASYTDKDGNTVEAIQGVDARTGMFRPFTVFFSPKERVYQCRKEQKVTIIKNGDTSKPIQIELYKYIKGHPNCEDTLNPSIDNPAVVFKELNEAADSKLHTDRIKNRLKAENKALELKGEALDQVANYIGEFSDNPDIKFRSVLLFAGKDPNKFLDIVESEETPIRSLIRKAISIGKLKQTGGAIFWDKEALGGSEDHAVAYLLANKEKLDALKQVVKKLK